MSAVSSLFHIFINTLSREMTIPDDASEQLYRYISAIVKSRSCRLVRINGIDNQRGHHRSKTYEDEYRQMIERSGLEWNDYRLT